LVSVRYENTISRMPNKFEFETVCLSHKFVCFTCSRCSVQCVIAEHITIIQNFMITLQMFQKLNGGQTPFHRSRIVHSFTPKIHANSLLSVRFNLLITNGYELSSGLNDKGYAVTSQNYLSYNSLLLFNTWHCCNCALLTCVCVCARAKHILDQQPAVPRGSVQAIYC